MVHIPHSDMRRAALSQIKWEKTWHTPGVQFMEKVLNRKLVLMQRGNSRKVASIN